MDNSFLENLLSDSKDITRMEAAKIFHEYLRNEIGEPDEPNIRAAYFLHDLYDCGSCSNHIAQMYIKGIILPVSQREFGTGGILSAAEIKAIWNRLNDVDKRVVPAPVSQIDSHATLLSETHHIPFNRLLPLWNQRDYKIIDVRTAEIFKDSFTNSKFPSNLINIPLGKLALNPHIISEDLFENIIFICEKGTSSALAAEYALNAGYINIFYSEYN